MTRYDLIDTSPAVMRRRIETALANLRLIEGEKDFESAKSGLVSTLCEQCEIVWAVWPDRDPGTRLGHGLGLFQGRALLEAHHIANIPAHVRVTAMMFTSYWEAYAFASVLSLDGVQHA